MPNAIHNTYTILIIHSKIEGADLVGQIIEYDGQIKQKVIQIYDHIKKFIKSKEFIGTDVEDEIKTEFGDILVNIEKQKEKVMVDECPIVIAGNWWFMFR